MSLLILSDAPKESWINTWITALRQCDPKLAIQVWPQVTEPERIEFALVWNHPRGELQKFPQLKVISSMGAGVDHLLNDPSCPRHLAIVRIVDQNLIRDMTQYIIWAVLNHARQFDFYQQSQQRKLWIRRSYANFPQIGIMGLGQLGANVALSLHGLGYTVRGWADSPKSLKGVQCFYGENQLGDFLAHSNILICLLPLTPATQGILNQQNFAQLPQDAYIINVARGAHLVEEDLLASLESGQLSGACMDVFPQEPLPQDHPFWLHPKITITPHIASMTDPVSAAKQVIENYQRMVKGQPLLNQVNLDKGY